MKAQKVYGYAIKCQAVFNLHEESEGWELFP